MVGTGEADGLFLVSEFCWGTDADFGYVLDATTVLVEGRLTT
jgi:hypothetical protein